MCDRIVSVTPSLVQVVRRYNVVDLVMRHHPEADVVKTRDHCRDDDQRDQQVIKGELREPRADWSIKPAWFFDCESFIIHNAAVLCERLEYQ